MKRILWVSRHAPYPEQERDLAKIYQEGMTIIQHPYNVKSADEIIAVMKRHKCDDMVAVLPVNLLADLTSKGVHPIRACMGRNMDENSPQVTFEHLYYTRVKNVIIEEERLT